MIASSVFDLGAVVIALVVVFGLAAVVIALVVVVGLAAVVIALVVVVAMVVVSAGAGAAASMLARLRGSWPILGSGALALLSGRWAA